MPDLLEMMNMKYAPKTWKDISGYKGYYQICEDKRVRSVPRLIDASNGQTRSLKSVVLSFAYNNAGIFGCILYKEGKEKYFDVEKEFSKYFPES